MTITQTESPCTDTRKAAAVRLRGIAKKMGSALTVERFLEMRREDLRLEEETIDRFQEKAN